MKLLQLLKEYQEEIYANDVAWILYIDNEQQRWEQKGLTFSEGLAKTLLLTFTTLKSQKLSSKNYKEIQNGVKQFFTKYDKSRKSEFKKNEFWQYFKKNGVNI